MREIEPAADASENSAAGLLPKLLAAPRKMEQNASYKHDLEMSLVSESLKRSHIYNKELIKTCEAMMHTLALRLGRSLTDVHHLAPPCAYDLQGW